MNPITIVKAVTDIVVSAGAGAVVGNAIKASTPVDIKTAQKVSIAVGGFVLSGMAGQAASRYASEQIESTAAQVKALKDVFGKKN